MCPRRSHRRRHGVVLHSRIDCLHGTAHARGNQKSCRMAIFRPMVRWITTVFPDRPVHLAAQISIQNDQVCFDFTGSDVQRSAPVNSTAAMTFSACAYVLKCLIDPDVPVNAGFYNAVQMVAPEGTVVNCSPHAPVVGGWETQLRLTDVMLRALASAFPDNIPAGTKAMVCHAGFGGIIASTGEYYCFLETLAGGYGGRVASDGAGRRSDSWAEYRKMHPLRRQKSTTLCASRATNWSKTPKVLVNSGADWASGVTTSSPTMKPPSPSSLTGTGRDPGAYSAANLAALPVISSIRMEKPSDLVLKPTVQLQPGDIVSYRTCGGGGYGLPAERDPERVLRDVRNGMVSRERAREIYRTEIDTEAWRVNNGETMRLRSEIT